MPFLFEEKESWKCDTLRLYTPRIEAISEAISSEAISAEFLRLRKTRALHSGLK